MAKVAARLTTTEEIVHARDKRLGVLRGESERRKAFFRGTCLDLSRIHRDLADLWPISSPEGRKAREDAVRFAVLSEAFLDSSAFDEAEGLVAYYRKQAEPPGNCSEWAHELETMKEDLATRFK